ncbi:MAG: SAM-dependent methyltransferase [Prevotella sp.]|nr:SAM-dependent methyltransferase [Prevotella sp.]MBR0049219.1 SAM-dependent methyltransferase [Prevotella sp.]
MELFPDLKKRYTEEHLSAREAQRLAEFIAWGPMVFQVSRLMVKTGILEMIRNSSEGITLEEIIEHSGLTDYAVKCLMEASLAIGTILVDADTDRFTISKTGWFLLNDPATRVNLNFNHDVNYIGMFKLEESLSSGKPEGLRHFGEWPTIYEGLSSLPADVQKSWFDFDHFYSDSSFDEALRIIFDEHKVKSLYDVGGNTGKWALRCVDYSPEVRVTILDLPQQIQMMLDNTKGKKGAERISGYGINLLDENSSFPEYDGELDAIWMSQFLDCFSMDEITSILLRARKAMTSRTRIYIMETLWDRQRFEPAAFCMTMTSLYFTAMANGNSKMYNTRDMELCIKAAGLEIEHIYDYLGQGHSILVVKKAE